jgi:hypothetical protein
MNTVTESSGYIKGWECLPLAVSQLPSQGLLHEVNYNTITLYSVILHMYKYSISSYTVSYVYIWKCIFITTEYSYFDFLETLHIELMKM